MDEFDEGRTREEYEAALQRFPYPLEIVPGDEALRAFEDLKSSASGTPLILGGVFAFTRIQETMDYAAEEHPSVELILSRAADLRFPRDFRAQRDRELAGLRRRYPAIASRQGIPIGDWPEGVDASPGLTLAYRDPSTVYSRIHLAVLPTRDWTEAPAFLKAGGWNNCPEAAMQVAALRAWRDRHDIELVACSHDTMNIRVGAGPTSREQALALAEEHCLFCPDLTPNALAELAAELIAHDWWCFWWD